MPYESPSSVLFDVDSNPMAVTGGMVVPVSTSALLFAGMTTTGTASYFKATDDGTLFVTGTLTTALSGAVDQGNAGSQAQGWFVRITDGTQVLGTGSSAPLWVTGSLTVPNLLTVTGSVSVLNTVTITGTVTANQGTSGSINQSWYTSLTDGTKVLGTGSSAPLFVEGAVHTGSLITPIARTASVVALVPSSSQIRRGVTIYNDAGTNLFILYGSGTVNQTTNYSIKMAGQSYLEVPEKFTGPIYGIWASAGSGNALVTEFYP